MVFIQTLKCDLNDDTIIQKFETKFNNTKSLGAISIEAYFNILQAREKLYKPTTLQYINSLISTSVIHTHS